MTTLSPLARLIVDLIRHEGPIGLDRYMALAIGHPILGYYATRDPFGVDGDFITAPEISQMFGEMVGLWAADRWLAMGSPAAFQLVELGPGRGTLMADLLRAARVVPGFVDAAEVHLVETSPVLRAAQRRALAGTPRPPAWHDSLETVSPGPLLVLANEFFDALPVRHFQRTERGWCERLVGLGPEDRFVFGLAPEPEPRLTLPGPDGAVIEIGAAGQLLMRGLAGRIVQHGGAGLVIDYGYGVNRGGETLQALHRHGPADPLREPGEADITAHVDFSALAQAARAAGAAVHGPVTQGAFLRAMGIEARASRLAAARPEDADAVEAALARLTREGAGMGELFKVLAVTAPGQPLPAGFPADGT